MRDSTWIIIYSTVGCLQIQVENDNIAVVKGFAKMTKCETEVDLND